MGRYFGTNGIRGVLGRGFFTLDFVCDMAGAIGLHLTAGGAAEGRDPRGGPAGPVLVGYDGRASGPLLCSAVSAALSYAGTDCMVAGMVSTPCLEYEVRRRGYPGGIMITASHNPPEYNGLKVVAADGVEISRSDEEIIERIYGAGERAAATAPGADGRSEAGRGGDGQGPRWGRISRARDPFLYIPGIVSQVDRESISASGLTVVIDSGNGVQGAHAAQLCDALGCRYVMINGEVDGGFPGRGPEPTPQNLSQLSRAVSEGGADLGVAFDGDGDRSIFCDEEGRIIIGDRSALILVKHILGKNRGASVATCLNSSSSAERVASQFGSRVIRARVGSVEVSQCIRETGALVGYEENGGFMYSRHNAVRDGCMTLALMLEALAHSGMTASQHAEALPPSYTAKTKVSCGRDAAGAAMARLAGTLDVADDRDGIKVVLSDAGDKWVLIRPSGTEPAVRVYAEAPTQEEADRIVAEYASMLPSAGGDSGGGPA